MSDLRARRGASLDDPASARVRRSVASSSERESGPVATPSGPDLRLANFTPVKRRRNPVPTDLSPGSASSHVPFGRQEPAHVDTQEDSKAMDTGTDVRTPEFMLDYLDNAVVGLHWVDGDTITVWANKADYEPLGYTEEEYVGHSITEFHADPDVIADILQRLLAGESLYNYKARLLCKDGSTLSVLIASSGLFDADGNLVHTRCFTIKDPSVE